MAFRFKGHGLQIGFKGLIFFGGALSIRVHLDEVFSHSVVGLIKPAPARSIVLRAVLTRREGSLWRPISCVVTN